MDSVKVEEARERARLTSQVYALTGEGNLLFARSACCSTPAMASALHQQAQALINRADEVKGEFWDKYPQAYIAPSCPWMRKDHDC
jgi:hypothetical protein